MSTTRSAIPTAPATEPPGGADALVLCAHGSRETADALARRAHALTARGRFAATAGCALKGEPDLERTLAALPDTRVLLVPFLMAEGHSYDRLRQRLAGLADAPPVVLCAPVGTHPAMALGILRSARERAAALAWRCDQSALLLVAHGTPRNRASRRALLDLRQAVAAAGSFAETGFALLEEEPSLAQALAAISARHVIVVGVFAEAGRHGADDIPALLAAADRETCYLGPIGREPWIDEIVLTRAREGGSRAGTNPREASG